MEASNKIDDFLSGYSEEVFTNALELRKVLFANLPGITEQVDIPAKMIAYCYGQQYAEMICTIIPSKKGLKTFYHIITIGKPRKGEHSGQLGCRY